MWSRKNVLLHLTMNLNKTYVMYIWMSKGYDTSPHNKTVPKLESL
jgi:hypothetical protein